MKKVAVLIETSRGYGRGILRGAVKYSRRYGPWNFYLAPGTIQQEMPDITGLDGIIARVDSPAVARAVLGHDIPAVVHEPPANFAVPERRWRKLVDIQPSPAGIAAMAAEHLLGLGLRNFAFFGEGKTRWSAQRQDEFVWYMEMMNLPCSVYRPSRRKKPSWQGEIEAIAAWLARLEKPLGVMAATDVSARVVLDACLFGGMKVPDEIAVIGVDNDELFCDLCQPPLSSVELDGVKSGFESARLLDEMMRGGAANERVIFVEPTRVVQRASTDMLAIDDEEIARAVRFIRANAKRNIGVGDVAAEAALSRRSLEMRFRRILGRSVSDEIRRVRLERAKELLIQTAMPISQAAKLSGFSSETYMGAIFRKKLGMTPMKFRRKNRT